MPSGLLFDISRVDLSNIETPIEGIRKVNPHRYEFELLSGIIESDVESGEIIGFKDIRENEFWVRGHVPGMPLMPGVLMVEAAAQLTVYLYKMTVPAIRDKFIAFAGVDEARFRGVVKPGNRLFLLGKRIEMNSRISKCKAQGLVDGKLVFECTILGMALKG